MNVCLSVSNIHAHVHKQMCLCVCLSLLRFHPGHESCKHHVRLHKICIFRISTLKTAHPVANNQHSNCVSAECALAMLRDRSVSNTNTDRHTHKHMPNQNSDHHRREWVWEAAPLPLYDQTKRVILICNRLLRCVAQQPIVPVRGVRRHPQSNHPHHPANRWRNRKIQKGCVLFVFACIENGTRVRSFLVGGTATAAATATAATSRTSTYEPPA